MKQEEGGRWEEVQLRSINSGSTLAILFIVDERKAVTQGGRDSGESEKEGVVEHG